MCLSVPISKAMHVHVCYCGYKYASAKPQILAKSFTDMNRVIMGFMLCAMLDTNSIIMLYS